MNIKPEDPLWEERDRLILSKGHAAPALYAALALRGYFPTEELRNLRKLNSMLLGHPMCKVPGVDSASGSLGQGLSIGLGMRIAGKLKNLDFRVFVILGDGEIQEGQVWEAAMAAAHFRISNLIAILDYNRVQLDGTVEKIMEVAPVEDKCRAFGWKVINTDGHNTDELSESIDEATELAKTGPVVIIAKTVKGRGVSFMENKAEWHGKCPDQEEMKQALSEITRNLEGVKL
jgi:transketolase